MKNIFRFLFVVFCLFTSTNSLHAQWLQTNGPYEGNVLSLVVSDTNLLAGTKVAGPFCSTNYGTSWTAVNSGLANVIVYSFLVSGTNLFAGTSGKGVFLSTDNGTSWTQVDSGLTDKTVYALAVSGLYLFAGTAGGGVFLSTNNGTSWAAVDAGLTSPGVYSLAVSGTNLFAGTYGGGVFLSTNNGTSWAQVDAGLTNTLVNALAVSGPYLFAGTAGGGVFLSTNDGTNWTAVDAGLTNATIFSLLVFGTNLFAGTSGGGVFLSTNIGTSWTQVNTGLTDETVNALAVSGPYLFAGTSSGVVWKRPLSEMIPTIVLSQPVIAFGSVPAHFAKIDTLIIMDSSSIPLMIDSVYTGTKWFTVASLHETVNEANTVTLPVLFTPDTAKAYSDTLYILSNSIVALTKVPLSGNGKPTAVSQNESGIPKSYGISQNYPNPFNPTTVIRYQLPVNSFVTLKVYDMLGREVKTLVSERQNAGYQSVTFDASGLPSGIYFYRLSAGSSGQTGSFMQTKKLVVIK